MMNLNRNRIRFSAMISICCVFIGLVFLWPNLNKTNVVMNNRIVETPTSRIGVEKSQESSTPAVTPTTTPVSPEFRVAIVDAIGDPIPGGTLVGDGSEYVFQAGTCTLPINSSGRYEMTAHAPGYATASATIRDLTGTSNMIVLEYLHPLQFAVYDDPKTKVPVPNAEILLWKGPSVQRPIFNETSLSIHTMGGDYKATFQESEGSFQLIGISDTSDSNSDLSDRNDIPHLGDRLIALSSCELAKDEILQYPLRAPFLPLLYKNSLHLRVWDALCYYSENSTNTEKFDDMVEFEKSDASRFLNYIWRVPQSAKRELYASKLTDENGMCRFDDLPPGTYVAQAHQDEKFCDPLIIHPARGGMEFYLSQAGERNMGILEVSVAFSGSDDVAMSRRIEGAQVIVQTKKGYFSTNTDMTGYATFDSVSWGECTIKVLPTEDVSFSPIIKKVDFQEKRKTIKVMVDGGFTIRGKVIQDDTKVPVPNFALMLFFKKHNKPILGKPGSPGVYDQTKTAMDGSFSFLNVRPGEYLLTALEESNFIGISQKEAVDDSLKNKDKVYFQDTRLDIQIIDKDLEEIVYKVLPRTRTRFKGIVITTSGEPLSGAKVEIGSIITKKFMGEDITALNKLTSIEGKTTTDEQGLFDFTIFSTPSDRMDSKVVTAKITTAIEFPPNSISNPASSPKKSLTGIIQKEGSTEVQYKIGDTIDNIQIVADEPDYCEITGKITTADGVWPITIDPLSDETEPQLGMIHINGKWPLCVELSGSQKNHHNIPGEIDETGNYRIRLPEKNQSILFVFLSLPYFAPNFTKPYIPPYCSSTAVAVENPDGLREIHHDIQLKIAGYLSGKVVDKNNHPLAYMTVQASSPYENIEKNIYPKHSAVTNEDGYFLISDLQVGLEYSLIAASPGEENPVASIENLVPTVENIILQIRE